VIDVGLGLPALSGGGFAKQVTLNMDRKGAQHLVDKKKRSEKGGLGICFSAG